MMKCPCCAFPGAEEPRWWVPAFWDHVQWYGRDRISQLLEDFCQEAGVAEEADAAEVGRRARDMVSAYLRLPGEPDPDELTYLKIMAWWAGEALPTVRCKTELRPQLHEAIVQRLVAARLSDAGWRLTLAENRSTAHLLECFHGLLHEFWGHMGWNYGLLDWARPARFAVRGGGVDIQATRQGWTWLIEAKGDPAKAQSKDRNKYLMDALGELVYRLGQLPASASSQIMLGVALPRQSRDGSGYYRRKLRRCFEPAATE